MSSHQPSHRTPASAEFWCREGGGRTGPGAVRFAGTLLAMLLMAAGPALGEAPPKISIGVEVNSPPLSFVNTAGISDGFAAGLLREMEQTGVVSFTIAPGPWSFILQEFEAGRIDALANVTISDERRETMDFSITHASVHSITYTRPDRPRIRHTADFAGRTMGTLSGTFVHNIAVIHEGWGARIVQYYSWSELLRAVKKGDCDFALLMRPLKFEQPDEMGLRREFVDDLIHYFHIAVHRGDRETLERINEALAIVRHSGAFDRLYAKWIGPIEPHPISLLDLRPYYPPAAGILLILALVFAWQRHINRRLWRQTHALHASEEKYRLLVENAHEVIFVVQDNQVKFVNKAATLLTGIDPAHIIDRSIFDFFPMEQQVDAVARRDRLLRGELAEASDEYQVSVPGGNGPWLQVTSVRIEWEGRPATLNLGADVTARHHAENVLRESLREKEGLLKEIHHRVKNNLQVVTSLLRLEAGRSKVEATRTALQEMQGRIRSMALLHEMLYRSSDFAGVDLADYLRQLATQLFRALNTRFGAIRLHLELESITLGIDQAIPCGLIVNELLTNSLKHAFSDGREGEIRIGLVRTPAGPVQLDVSDNGVGLPADLAGLRTSSLGLQLVTDLARQLHGKLAFSTPGTGAVFTITFAPTEPPPPGNGSPAQGRDRLLSP